MLESPHVRAPIAISLGAIAGALGRHYAEHWLSLVNPTAFPVGTFFVNLSGSLLMGFFTTAARHRPALKPESFLLLATGFLGSYTTFSTYALEVAQLFDQHHLITGLTYWLGSPVLGILGLGLGIVLAKLLFPTEEMNKP